MMVCNVYTKFYIVLTLTVVVATLSVNKMKMMVGNVYSMFNSVDTNGCSSNYWCRQAKMVIGLVYTKFYCVDTNGCSSNA